LSWSVGRIVVAGLLPVVDGLGRYVEAERSYVVARIKKLPAGKSGKGFGHLNSWWLKRSRFGLVFLSV